MRQAQQNRRGRGRNRKGQNPLTRTYESNGPDVKIRGTPAHIAEKYVSMARDALSSGDPVLAENYLQHAEHYNRIIMAHREQQIADDGRPGNGAGRARSGQDYDDDGDDIDSGGSEKPVARGHEPQPSFPPASQSDSDDEDRGQGHQRGQGRQRDDDNERTSASDRSGESERSGRGDRSSQGDRPNAGAGNANGARGNGRRRPRYAENDDQPEFLKRPVRRRVSASSDETNGETPDGSVEADQAAE